MRLFKNLFAFEESKKQMDEEILFHYTSEAGLQGILQNKCLWATDVSSTNDISEINLGFILLKKIVLGSLAENRRSIAMETLVKSAATILERENIFFLVSFSSVSDNYTMNNGLLSQWRGYGSYAIKFRKNILSNELGRFKKEVNIISDLNRNVRYCGYDYDLNLDASLGIQEFIDLISTEEWKEIDKKINLEVELTEKEYDKLIEALIRFFIPMLFVKHKGFKEEKERRIVVLVPKNCSSKKIHFHAPNKSHIKLFEEDQAIIENAIEEIIIGPVSDQKAAKHRVDSMLREFGYKNVKVKCSEIPFRKS